MYTSNYFPIFTREFVVGRSLTVCFLLIELIEMIDCSLICAVSPDKQYAYTEMLFDNLIVMAAVCVGDCAINVHAL